MNLPRRIVIPLLLFVLAFSVFFPSLENSFVWDDQILIEREHKKFENNVSSYIFNDFFRSSADWDKVHYYYRPASYSTLIADYVIWKDKSFGYHLTNNLLFALTVLAFYFLALIAFRKLTDSEDDPVLPAVVAALVFIFHPVHVESVSWISGRTDIVCALFLIMGLIAHFRSSSNVFFVLAPVFFAFSLWSKEVAVVFPFIAVFGSVLTRQFKKRDAVLSFIYLILLTLYIFVRTKSLLNPTLESIAVSSSSSLQSAQGSVLSAYLEPVKILLCSLGIYMEKLLLPFNLNAYIYKVSTSPLNLISSVVLTVSVTAVFILSLIRRHYFPAFAIFTALITILPSLPVAVMPIASIPIAERYLFIPSLGYALLLGFVFSVLSRKIKPAHLLTLLILLLGTFTYLNMDRQLVWKDRVTFWGTTASQSDHAFPHSNYALALQQVGRTQEALKFYEAALNPALTVDNDQGRVITMNNLALLYMNQGDYQRAEVVLLTALKLSPDYNRTLYKLGLVSYVKGGATGSEEVYKAALEYLNRVSSPGVLAPKLRLLRARVLMKLGRPEQAITEVNAAMKMGIKGALLNEALAIRKIYEESRGKKPQNDAGQ